MKMTNKAVLSETLKQAMLEVKHRLGDQMQHCLVGGSSGLLLQGVQLDAPPRDLDIYLDLPYMDQIFPLLHSLCLDKPRWDETEMYRSYLSHYQLDDITLELVADFEVRNGNSEYKVKIDQTLKPYSQTCLVSAEPFQLMPLAHEFVFNILRERPDRYQRIATVVNKSPQSHVELFHKIWNENQFSSAHLSMMRNVLHPILM